MFEACLCEGSSCDKKKRKKKAWHFLGGVQKNVMISQKAGSSMKFSPQNDYFHQPLTLATCNPEQFWNMTPLEKGCDWQKVFILLVWNNSRKLPLKLSFSGARSCLHAEWLLFLSSFSSSKEPNSATKENMKKKNASRSSSATLKCSDERSQHEKQSSKAIFIPFAVWSAEIKVAYGCHRDAGHSGRLTTTRGICAFLNHVCPAHSWQGRHTHTDETTIIWNCVFLKKKISKSKTGWQCRVPTTAPCGQWYWKLSKPWHQSASEPRRRPWN